MYFLEQTGQGEEECFISQPQALLYSFVLPVALLMFFNLYALGHTVVHIIKTRKVMENHWLTSSFMEPLIAKDYLVTTRLYFLKWNGGSFQSCTPNLDKEGVSVSSLKILQTKQPTIDPSNKQTPDRAGLAYSRRQK